MIAAFTVAATVSLAAPAHAGSSNWHEMDAGKLRLVGLPSADGKKLEAGLQIVLKPGWKTYWRSPGDSGLPPQIQFGRSQNIAETKLDFPVPKAFSDGSVGYYGSVTFPIDVTPLFADQKVTLSVDGLIGVCSEVCVPVPFQLSLVHDKTGGSSSFDVAAALQEARGNLMRAPSEAFGVKSTSLSKKDGKEVLRVTARVPVSAKDATLLIEGDRNWYFSPQKAVSVKDGHAEFVVPLSSTEKNADATQTKFRMSLVTDGLGVEQTITPSR